MTNEYHKDMQGKPVKVGDYVICTTQGYESLQWGYVTKLTPKGFKVMTEQHMTVAGQVKTRSQIALTTALPPRELVAKINSTIELDKAIIVNNRRL